MKQQAGKYNFLYFYVASGFVSSSLTCTVEECILLRHNKKGALVFKEMYLTNTSFWMVSVLQDIEHMQ